MLILFYEAINKPVDITGLRQGYPKIMTSVSKTQNEFEVFIIYSSILHGIIKSLKIVIGFKI